MYPIQNLLAVGFGGYGRLGQNNTHNSNRFIHVHCQDNQVTVIDVACGAGHVVATTDHGSIYSWGKCHFGQLGHGDSDVDEFLPKKIQGLNDVVVSSVYCGQSNSFAISDQGVYSWGCGYFGSLCHGNETNFNIPKKLNLSMIKM